MTTKYEDGLNVLGMENKSLVDNIEKEFQNQKINKSDIKELIERSIEEVDGNPVGSSPSDIILSLKNLDFNALLDLVKTMTEDGEIDETELSKRINYMINATTDKSKVEKVEPEKTDNVEKCDSPEVYQPFGGATSLAEANSFIDSIKMEDAMYKLYSIFGGLSQNILSSTDDSVTKSSKLQGLLSEFRNSLTPQGLAAYKSEATDEVTNETIEAVKSVGSKVDNLLSEIQKLVLVPAKAETKIESDKVENSAEEPEWKSIVRSVDTLLTNSVSKTGNDRKESFQTILTTLGEELNKLHLSLPNEVVEQKSTSIDSTDLENTITKALGNVVNEIVVPLQQQMAVLNKKFDDNLKVSKSTVLETPRIQAQQPKQVPVSRSIPTNIKPPQLPQPARSSNQGMSIMDIARRSTTGGA